MPFAVSRIISLPKFFHKAFSLKKTSREEEKLKMRTSLEQYNFIIFSQKIGYWQKLIWHQVKGKMIFRQQQHFFTFSSPSNTISPEKNPEKGQIYSWSIFPGQVGRRSQQRHFPRPPVLILPTWPLIPHHTPLYPLLCYKDQLYCQIVELAVSSFDLSPIYLIFTINKLSGTMQTLKRSQIVHDHNCISFLNMPQVMKVRTIIQSASSNAAQLP